MIRIKGYEGSFDPENGRRRQGSNTSRSNEEFLTPEISKKHLNGNLVKNMEKNANPVVIFLVTHSHRTNI